MNRARIWLATGDRWIPALIVAAFLAMMAVNARMVWLAVATHPGLVTDPVLRPAAGLSVAIDYAGEAMRAAPVRVRIADAQGRPVAGTSVTLSAERPVRYPQKIVVPLDGRDGVHEGALALPVGGPWVLSATVRHPGGTDQARRTVTVAPGRER